MYAKAASIDIDKIENTQRDLYTVLELDDFDLQFNITPHMLIVLLKISRRDDVEQLRYNTDMRCFMESKLGLYYCYRALFAAKTMEMLCHLLQNVVISQSMLDKIVNESCDVIRAPRVLTAWQKACGFYGFCGSCGCVVGLLLLPEGRGK